VGCLGVYLNLLVLVRIPRSSVGFLSLSPSLLGPASSLRLLRDVTQPGTAWRRVHLVRWRALVVSSVVLFGCYLWILDVSMLLMSLDGPSFHCPWCCSPSASFLPCCRPASPFGLEGLLYLELIPCTGVVVEVFLRRIIKTPCAAVLPTMLNLTTTSAPGGAAILRKSRLPLAPTRRLS